MILAHRRHQLFNHVACTILFLSLALTSRLSAQTDPRLVEAVRLAQEGMGDSARASVNRVLNQLTAADSLYPQTLYTLGLVSRSVDEMRRQYTRVAVEYTYSDWADDALVRLGMLDYAGGNPQGTLRQMEKVATDYPQSPLIPTAAVWAARAAFETRKPADGCRWVATGLAAAGSDVELKNQLEFYNGRCAGGVPPESTQAAADTAKPPPPAKASREGYGLQVGAVTTQAAADKLLASLKAAGLKGYAVKDGNLLKVRAGPYPDRDKALAAIPKVRGAVGGSPFVVKEQ
ncbi:MAG TPA: SPOR domain-containing protein [Gemmatimonadales bacterium]|nr:SPOR domain-containing protein [Gemmatimonadales bacterium]